VLVVLAIPLALSLRQIAWEAWATRTARAAVEAEFGENSRLSGFDPNFAGDTVRIRATVFTDRFRDKAVADLERELAATLGRPVRLRLSQILVNDGSQRAELDRARLVAQEARNDRLAQADLATRLTYAVGVPSDAITIDSAARRALIDVDGSRPLAELHQLELRARAENPDWDIQLLPPLQALPPLLFAEGSAEADAAVREQLQLTLWALERWDAEAVTLTGNRAPAEPAGLAEARAQALAPLLRACGLQVTTEAAAPDRDEARELGEAALRRVTAAMAMPSAAAAPADASGEACIRTAGDGVVAPAPEAAGVTETTTGQAPGA
jgi:hypothetical protein